jgi:lysophospholipase L1-like esterase
MSKLSIVSYRLCVPWFFLILILITGSVIRLHGARDLIWWPANGLGAGGVLCVHDGYRYLEKARDIHESINSASWLDMLARPFLQPELYPLLSVLVALISFVTLAPLEWVGVFMPAVVSCLLAIPVFFAARKFLGTSSGLVASMMCLVHPFYLARTHAGCLETDILNVTAYTFIALAGVDLFRGGASHTLTRLVFMALAVFLACAIWPYARTPTLFYGVMVFTCALLPGFWQRFKEKNKSSHLVVIGLFVFIATALFLSPLAGELLHTLTQFWFAFTNQTVGSHALMVHENRLVTFSFMAQSSNFDLLLYFAAIVPSFWFFIYRPTLALPFVPLFLLGLSGIGSIRFLEFMAPVMGLGFAAMIQQALRGTRWSWRCLVWSCSGVIALILVLGAMRNDMRPVIRLADAQALSTVSKNLPAEAVLWTHWSVGYASQYYARRPSLFNGGMISGFTADCNAIPFTARNDAAAAGFMRWYDAAGEDAARDTMNWLKRSAIDPYDFLLDVLARPRAEGERWLKTQFPDVDDVALTGRLFPPSRRPVYLLMDASLSSTLFYPCASQGCLLADEEGHDLYCRIYLLNDPVLFMRSLQTPGSSIRLLRADTRTYRRDQLEGVVARTMKTAKVSADPSTYRHFWPWPNAELLDELRAIRSIAVVGDSISAGGLSGGSANYWGILRDQLANELGHKDIRVSNYSRPGARTSDLPDLTRSWRSQGVDLTIFALGMNDLADLASGKSFQSWQRDFTSALDVLSSKTSSTVVLLAPAPTPGYWDLHYTDQDLVVNFMKEEAHQRGFLFADAFSVFRNALQKYWFYDLMVDAINHPNEKGHYLYACAIRLALSNDPGSEP